MSLHQLKALNYVNIVCALRQMVAIVCFSLYYLDCVW